MPYNRTRTWVGVAIVAVTIPAVGTFYNASRTKGLRGDPIAAANHAVIRSRPTDSFGSARISIHPASRDYDAEVGDALGRQNQKAVTLDDALPGSDDDPMFDLYPLTPVEEPLSAPSAPIANPAGEVAQAEPIPTIAETRDLVTNDVTAADDGEIPQLSDRTVYALVLNNLPQDQRGEFVDAYAAMTPDQRADLLDEFRARLQGDE